MIDAELKNLMERYAGTPMALKIHQLLSADFKPLPFNHNGKCTLTIPGYRWVYKDGELEE